ncbi:MAG: hypothetical protein KAJ49_06150, partial [Arcobacteraceae bacterium]|nr:hypothetical protein [Arcobacteraceae bacterium]
KIVDNVKNGNLKCSEDGICSYTSLDKYSGKDSFSYVVNDGKIDSKKAIVSIEVVAKKEKKNNAPTAQDINIDVKSGIEKEFKLIGEDKDGDKFIFKIKSDVENGSLDCTKDGICKYKSLEEYSGDDSFSYQVIDIKTEKSNIANVKINVEERNSLPKTKIHSEDELKYKEQKEYLNFLFGEYEQGSSDAEQAIHNYKSKNPKIFDRFINEMTNK